MSQQGSIFDLLLGVAWWFRDAGSAHSVHGPSLWPARRFGTLYRQLERSGSWQGQLKTFAEDASIFTVLIEAFSVLEMFTLYKFTYLLIYLASQ